MPRALTQQEIRDKESFIIEKAVELFQSKTFKAFKLDDLAKKCNMSKGILFKYFRTKEMLFLSILHNKYDKLFTRLDEELRNHKEMTLDEFKEYFLEGFSRQFEYESVFLKLLRIQNAILEENQDYEFAFRTKSNFNGLLLEYCQNILFKVQGVTLEQLKDLFSYQTMITKGYLNSLEQDKEIIDNEGLSMYDVDYKDLALRAMKYYLDNEL